MASTNYRTYKWLIETLYNAGADGCTMKDLNDKYSNWRYHQQIKHNRNGVNQLKGVHEIKHSTFWNWRGAIYRQFSLIIDNISRDYYKLMNPELLDESKTLWDMIDLLSKDEERGYEPIKAQSYNVRGKIQRSCPKVSMSFISVGSNGCSQFYYPESDAPQMVNTINYAITIGKALVIKYVWGRHLLNGRINTEKRSKRYVLEPQQLVNIYKKWYVAGNLYEYGNREISMVVIYDVERIILCDDEDIIYPEYSVREGFDIYSFIPVDWTEHFNPDKVLSLYLMALGRILENTPFCQAQEKLDVMTGFMCKKYKVYLKPDNDFFIQYMAYGDEVRVVDCPANLEKSDTDITDAQIGYLRGLRRKGL